MKGLRQAVAFLTRIPVGETGGIERAVGWFPGVGALVGLAVAGSYAAAYWWLPSLLAAVIATTVGVVLTGALHEDGLADSFDALGSGVQGDEAHEIMRDSRLGTHGMTALGISLLWRIVALAALAPAGALAGLVMAHTLGRAGAVSLMALGPSARADGLGSSGVTETSRGAVWGAVLSALGLSLLAAGWWVVTALALVVIVVAILRAVSVERFGGITGDLLGASEQISEMAVLAVVAGAAWSGWEPWWVG